MEASREVMLIKLRESTEHDKLRAEIIELEACFKGNTGDGTEGREQSAGRAQRGYRKRTSNLFSDS